MASVGSDDPNVKHLTGFLKGVINDLGAPPKIKSKKGGKHHDEPANSDPLNMPLTRSQYIAIQSKMYIEIVALMKGQEETSDRKIVQLTDENKRLRKQLVNTHLELERSNQYSNRDTFKICGIKEPQSANGQHRENTNDTVAKVLDKAGIAIKPEEISVSHRIGKGNAGTDKPKPILVKCSLQAVRTRVIRKRKAMRDSEAFKQAYPGAFIVEHLTPLRSKVAYKLRHDRNIAKTWTIDGRIKVIKVEANENDDPITIDSLSQLKLIGWSDDMIEELVLEE